MGIEGTHTWERPSKTYAHQERAMNSQRNQSPSPRGWSDTEQNTEQPTVEQQTLAGKLSLDQNKSEGIQEEKGISIHGPSCSGVRTTLHVLSQGSGTL